MKRVVLDNEPTFRLIESRCHRLFGAVRDGFPRVLEARQSVRAAEGELEAVGDRYRWESPKAEERERRRLQELLDKRRALLVRLSREHEETAREAQDARAVFDNCLAYLRERGVHAELAPAPGQEAPPFGANVIGGRS